MTKRDIRYTAAQIYNFCAPATAILLVVGGAMVLFQLGLWLTVLKCSGVFFIVSLVARIVVAVTAPTQSERIEDLQRRYNASKGRRYY